ncbi:MAG: cell wall hydrolase [Paracoccaceae bacterium]|nr:cell wall hydrolase [Paracoccaceae bacterium]
MARLRKWACLVLCGAGLVAQTVVARADSTAEITIASVHPRLTDPYEARPILSGSGPGQHHSILKPSTPGIKPPHAVTTPVGLDGLEGLALAVPPRRSPDLTDIRIRPRSSPGQPPVAILRPPPRSQSLALSNGERVATPHSVPAGVSEPVDAVRPLPRPGSIRQLRWKRVYPVLAEIAESHPFGSDLDDYDEWSCLTEAIYFEARGEPVSGQLAVAEIILNRRDSAKFPETICAVLEQGSRYRDRCQFSYKCDGLNEVFHEAAAHQRSARVARVMLDGFESNLTTGALFYHATTVRPRWSRLLTPTARIGDHYFYTRNEP